MLTTFLSAEADEVVDCVHEFQLLSLEDAVVGGGSCELLL